MFCCKFYIKYYNGQCFWTINLLKYELKSYDDVVAQILLLCPKNIQVLIWVNEVRMIQPIFSEQFVDQTALISLFLQYLGNNSPPLDMNGCHTPFHVQGGAVMDEVWLSSFKWVARCQFQGCIFHPLASVCVWGGGGGVGRSVCVCVGGGG